MLVLSKYIRCKKDLVVAKGVIFDKEKHEYYYKGKQLQGITGNIAKRLGLKYNNAFVSSACAYGTLVHEGVDRFIKTSKLLNNKDVIYTVKALEKMYFMQKNDNVLCGEVLVSDYKKYASAVDIFVITDFENKEVDIYDIKTGVINLKYVGLQLGMYKYLVEQQGWKVNKCGVIATKEQYVYTVHPNTDNLMEVFYGKE